MPEPLPGPASGGPGWLVAIPTAITLGNALCGFGAIVALSGWTPAAGEGAVATAGWLILAAWGCDMVDGMAARKLGTSGPFGAALDSLCDVVGFGVAPAFLVGALAASSGMPGWLGWLAGAALLAGVLIRLARFDAEDVADDGPDGHMWFRGLPSPAVGAVIAALGLAWWQAAAGAGALAWASEMTQLLAAWAIASAIPAVALIAALLAVSTLPYPDLPKHYLKGHAPRWHLVLLGLAIVGLGPGLGLLAYFGAYMVLGPLAGRRAGGAA